MVFEQILFESPFFERLTIARRESQLACEILRKTLEGTHKLVNLHTRQGFDKAWELLKDEKTQKVIYKSEAPRARFQSMLDEADTEEFYQDYWSPVTELFREDRPKARTVEKALGWLFSPDHPNRPILVVDFQRNDGVFGAPRQRL